MRHEDFEFYFSKLKAMKECAEDACEAAWNDVDCQEDAVNWGDFGCVEACFFINDDREIGYRVVLEEADPNCKNVQAFVAAWLYERDFGPVEVVTEW